MITTRSRRTFLKYAATAFAAGTSPLSIIQLSADAWGQTTVEIPDTYKTPGDNVTSRINLMLASSPVGSKNFLPASYGVLNPTPGQSYYLKYDSNKILISNSTPYNPIPFSDSGGNADVLLFEPTPPTYADLFGEQNNIALCPEGIQTAEWSLSNPKCSWARNVFRYKFNTGHGAGKFRVKHNYASFGTGYGFLCEGIAGQASMYSSVFMDCWSDGGYRFDKFGDNVQIIRSIMSGKMGIDFEVMQGAAQFVIAGCSGSPLGGPAIRGRGGNKVSIINSQFEQKGWNDSLFGTTRRVVDLRNENQTTNTKMNGLRLDDLTVANMSGQTMNHLVYVDNTILTMQGQVNCYATNPVATCIEYGVGCQYPMITRPPTFNGTFTNKMIVPQSTKPYGVRVGPAWWNTPFANPFNQTGNHVNFTKDPNTGVVTFAGEWQTTGTFSLPSVETVCGVLDGFGAKEEVAFPISQGFGLPSCFLIVSPANSAGPGVISMEGIHPNASRFRGSVSWHNKDHLDGLETQN